MSEPKRFLILADVDCSWEYEIYADSQEEALEMWRTGDYPFHVYQEHIGDVKATQIEDENYNVTKLSKGDV